MQGAEQPGNYLPANAAQAGQGGCPVVAVADVAPRPGGEVELVVNKRDALPDDRQRAGQRSGSVQGWWAGAHLLIIHYIIDVVGLPLIRLLWGKLLVFVFPCYVAAGGSTVS